MLADEFLKKGTTVRDVEPNHRVSCRVIRPLLGLLCNHLPAKIAHLGPTRNGSRALEFGSPLPGKWIIELAPGVHAQLRQIVRAEVFGDRTGEAIERDHSWRCIQVLPLV